MSRLLNVMLDLETMSTASNAAIVSIGAVKFSLNDDSPNPVVDTFYTTVDAKSCAAVGLEISKATVEWWAKQPRSVMDSLRKDAIPLAEALTKFSKWYGSTSLPTWGCGASFDNVIMGNAYEAVKLNRPWKYWHDRCYRTMKEIVKLPEDVRQGTYHNALDDALHQTNHLLKILKS